MRIMLDQLVPRSVNIFLRYPPRFMPQTKLIRRMFLHKSHCSLKGAARADVTLDLAKVFPSVSAPAMVTTGSPGAS